MHKEQKEKPKYAYNIEYSNEKFQQLIALFEKNSTVKMILLSETTVCHQLCLRMSQVWRVLSL
jgi:hypothetical protein